MAIDKASTTVPAPQAPKARRAQSEVMVARRYLDHGFIDAARRIFERNADSGRVAPDDWSNLVERLLERGRIRDAVQACQTGNVPLPRERLLDLGDRHLLRRDMQSAIRYYELADANQERWVGLVDMLTRLPGCELHATEVAQRHLVPTEPAMALRLVASA
jgi:hypothetical protein